MKLGLLSWLLWAQTRGWLPEAQLSDGKGAFLQRNYLCCPLLPVLSECLTSISKCPQLLSVPHFQVGYVFFKESSGGLLELPTLP